MPILQRNYLFDIWGQYVTPPDEELQPFADPIYIEIHIRYPDEPEITGKGILHRGLLLSDDSAWSSLSPTCSTVGMPIDVQTRLIPEISSYSRRMTAIQTCRDCHDRVVPAIFVLLLLYNETEAVTMAMEESMEADMFKLAPASKSTIEALEKVVFEGSGSVDQCMVCLEELRVGLEVTRMPCSHLYHGDCIGRWLETSHLCPLCRYQMPS